MGEMKEYYKYVTMESIPPWEEIEGIPNVRGFITTFPEHSVPRLLNNIYLAVPSTLWIQSYLLSGLSSEPALVLSCVPSIDQPFYIYNPILPWLTGTSRRFRWTRGMSRALVGVRC